MSDVAQGFSPAVDRSPDGLRHFRLEELQPRARQL